MFMKPVIFLIFIIKVVLNGASVPDTRITKRAIIPVTTNLRLIDEPACVAIRTLCANTVLEADDFYTLECIQTLRGEQKNLISK